MGNIVFQKASERQDKVSCKELTKDQKAYVKAKEQFDLADKELNRFYATAPRLYTGAVDFANMSDFDLDLFQVLNKKKEAALRKMDRLEGIIDVEKTMAIFLQTNTHSMSY